MRRINKSTTDNSLSDFSAEFPDANWDDFRTYQCGEPYKEIKALLFAEQDELCAYCEVSLKDDYSHNRRVEHFISKSNINFNGVNVALDWFNLLGVCVGGTNENVDLKYERRKHLSCDAHKEFFESSNNITNKDWHGKVLCPLTIPEPHRFFAFNRSTGEFEVNGEYCGQAEITPNVHRSIETLVQYTLDVFNLNCERLCQARLKVFWEFEKELNQARRFNNLEILVRKWKRPYPLQFQTTRDILLATSPLTAELI